MEATGIPLFLVKLGSFPLTLGRLGLVILGILSFFIADKKYLRSKFALSIYAISIGYFLGSCFSNDFSYEFLKSFILSLVLCSTITTAYLLKIKIFRNITTIYILTIFVYWTLYSIIAPQNISGEFLNYNLAYVYSLENELGIINYHKVGLLISVSSLAIFEFKNKIMQSYFKYIPLLLGLVFLINLGSRSNIVIIFLFIIFKIFKNFKFNKKNIISLITLGSLLTLIILLALGINEELRFRFSIINPANIFALKSRYQLLAYGISEILQNPLGTGPSDNRINFFGYQFQPHNQYLTFGVGAGLLGLLGSLIWIKIVYSSFVFINKTRNSKLLPYFAFTAVYLITMFTNDQSGSLLFLNLIFIQHLEINSKEEYYFNIET
ncbi:MAG: hypothetical protein JJ844_01010 [Prochlorococcus marinus CUG1435]|nr:hypothetical protein [Prochlorococcus marinus CUG1435]